MDESTSSQKRCAPQEVQDETPTDDHPSGHLSQQPQLDEMSDETLLIQRFATEGATLNGPKSSDNTISGRSQFEFVVRNLGKPSDLTPFSNAEKWFPMMPTMPILAQPILHEPTAPSIFSLTAIAPEQYHKAALMIELDGFDYSLLRTRVENIMTHISKYQELHNNFFGKLTETTFSMHLTVVQRQVKKTSSAKTRALKIEMQEVDAEIHKVNDEMSRDQHLMAHLATEQTNLRNTPIVSSKDSEDLKALHISLKEERTKVAQLKWMD
ncbi:hypothetical protein ACH5RR_007141 [Cinchona calisaya]|uniref:Uncharacterized protein n=1 Tax=Cinchona calisaya TaxID=153742 RepID=A0ABD3AR24_9GENT